MSLIPRYAYGVALARLPGGVALARPPIVPAVPGTAPDSPIMSEWPDATNTGVPVGTVLTNTSGRSLDTAGVTINAENISGTLTVNANNITIQNSKISASGFWAIRVMDGIGGTIIRDCEVDGLGNCGKGIRTGGASGNGTTILRCNIHDMADGIDITGDDCLIQDSYIHNFRDPAAVPHYDGIVNDGGCNRAVVRHNHVDASVFTNEHVNSNISFNDFWNPIVGATVDNNLMKGGSGNNRMLEFFGSNHPPNGCVNVVCTDNHFIPNGASTIVPSDPNVIVTTWSGNVNDTTGAAIANPYTATAPDSPPLYDDGFVGAPAGTPQWPDILDAYVARPAWYVAGVDYHVGIDRTLYPTNASLKNPTSASLPAGCSRNTTTHIWTITGDNVVVDGWDFSLNGGWSVTADGGSNGVIKNCNFKVTTTSQGGPLYVSSSATNFSILNNEIDGNSTLNQAIGIGLIGINAKGTTTVKYNWLKSAYGIGIVFSSIFGGETLDIRYNLIEDAGIGFSGGAHGDWIQCYNATGSPIGPSTAEVICKFNLWRQTIPIASGRTQGLSLFSANSGATSGGCEIETIENNCFIANNGAYVNFAIIVDTTRLITSASIKDNYFDPTNIGSANGGGGNWSFIGDYSGGNGGPYNGSVTTTGNTSMLDGTRLDGSAPQYPHLLDGYVAKPSWEVAGVHYYVGCPQDLVLKAPSTIAIAGVSVDSVNHRVSVTADNVTLDGYDFSLDGGWQVKCQSANTTIVNSKFAIGANDLTPIFGPGNGTDISVRYCDIDGNGKNIEFGGVITQWGAGLTVEYCWIKNAGADMFQTQGGGTVALRYNLLDGAGQAGLGHADYLQSVNGPFVGIFLYNTLRQFAGSSQGIMLEPDNAGGPDGVISSAEYGFNTMIAGGVDTMNFFIGITVADIVDTVTVHDNYFDDRAAFGFAPGGARGGPDDSSPKTIFTNNVNMVTGAVVEDTPPPLVGPISFGGAGTYLPYGARTNSTLAAPAGIANGDLLLAFLAIGGGVVPATPTPPAGWSTLPGSPIAINDSFGFFVKNCVFYKIAAGESGDYLFTTAAGNSTCGVICRYVGVDAANPFGPAPTANSGSGITATALGFTTTVENTLVIFTEQDWGNTALDTLPPSGSAPVFTERVDQTLIYIADGTVGAPRSTGNVSHQCNNNLGTDPWAAYLIGLKPSE